MNAGLSLAVLSAAFFGLFTDAPAWAVGVVAWVSFLVGWVLERIESHE